MRWHMTFTFPTLFLLWIFEWRYFLRYRKVFLYVLLGGIVWAVPFDVLAAPVFHIYYFHPTKNLGIWLWGIPLEEYLFILLVPQVVVALTLVIRRIFYGKV